MSKVKAVTPPKAAMYWSCLPMGSFRSSISSCRPPGELLGGDELALEGVQRVEQRHREAARRPEPGVGRHVGHAVSSMPALDAGHLERLAEDAVLDLLDRVDNLGLGVGQADVVVEAAGDADVDELVDRGGDEEAAVLARVAGQVGAAAAEGEAHRGAGDDHGADSRSKVPSRARHSPSGEPISKNLSWATQARKRFRRAEVVLDGVETARLARRAEPR